ncbi:FRG domain-containing protein [Mesorhizobium sp. M0663]|uniref:FRG domain-containing protein n=1 Tax=unclassified Mesorhizobium TaxID=325217 RepID=UPI00333C877E
MTGGARCYRGESDAKWQLKPSIMRGVRSDAENRIFSELMLEAPTEFSNDKSMFDMLVRAQHYGSISSLTISSQVRKEESMMRLRIVSAAPFTAWRAHCRAPACPRSERPPTAARQQNWPLPGYRARRWQESVRRSGSCDRGHAERGWELTLARTRRLNRWSTRTFIRRIFDRMTHPKVSH